jgi:hypothetical protein
LGGREEKGKQLRSAGCVVPETSAGSVFRHLATKMKQLVLPYLESHKLPKDALTVNLNFGVSLIVERMSI